MSFSWRADAHARGISCACNEYTAELLRGLRRPPSPQPAADAAAEEGSYEFFGYGVAGAPRKAARAGAAAGTALFAAAAPIWFALLLEPERFRMAPRLALLTLWRALRLALLIIGLSVALAVGQALGAGIEWQAAP